MNDYDNFDPDRDYGEPETDEVREVYAAHAQQEQRERLSAMWMQLEQIAHLDAYKASDWESGPTFWDHALRDALKGPPYDQEA